LEPDRVDHSGDRVPHAGWRRSRHRLERQALDDDSAEAIQIDEVRELDSITKSAAGGNYGVFEGKGTDSDSEVYPRGPV